MPVGPVPEEVLQRYVSLIATHKQVTHPMHVNILLAAHLT